MKLAMTTEKDTPNRAPIAAIALVGLVLIAGISVAMVVRRGSQAAPEQRAAGSSIPTATPVVAQDTPAPAADGESAVARGGSRNRTAGTNTTSGEVLLPGETRPTASPAVLGASKSGPLSIEVRSAEYDVSGTPLEGCSKFDAKTPVRRFKVDIAILNETGAPISPAEWGAAAFSGANRVTMCLANATTGLPTLAKDARTPITLLAFADAKSSISIISINTVRGFAASVCFDEEKVIACK